MLSANAFSGYNNQSFSVFSCVFRVRFWEGGDARSTNAKVSQICRHNLIAERTHKPRTFRTFCRCDWVQWPDDRGAFHRLRNHRPESDSELLFNGRPHLTALCVHLYWTREHLSIDRYSIQLMIFVAIHFFLTTIPNGVSGVRWMEWIIIRDFSFAIGLKPDGREIWTRAVRSLGTAIKASAASSKCNNNNNNPKVLIKFDIFILQWFRVDRLFEFYCVHSVLIALEIQVERGVCLVCFFIYLVYDLRFRTHNNRKSKSKRQFDDNVWEKISNANRLRWLG